MSGSIARSGQAGGVQPGVSALQSTIGATPPGSLETRLTIPTIEAFSRNIVGDGVTDDSAAVLEAHDAAAAAGVTVLYASKQYYIPTAAYALNKVNFVGPGALVGSEHKFVAPINAPAALRPFNSPVNARLGLAKMLASATPSYVLAGDSRSTTEANQLTKADTLYAMLRKSVRRANPNKTFTEYNRAISGTTWANFASTSTTDPNPTGHPDWTWSDGTSWLAQVTALQADTVFLAHGMNGAAAPSSFVNALVGLTGGAKIPDISFITPPMPKLSFAPASAVEQDQRLRNAGFARSLAASKGAALGITNLPAVHLIDVGRFMARATRGFDPASHVMSRALTGVTGVTSFPYTTPRTKDIDMKITLPGQAAASTSPGLTLRLDGSQGWNILVIDAVGSTVRCRYLVQNGGGILTSTGGSTPTYATSGDWTFRFTVKDSWARVSYINGSTETLLFDAPITRYDAAFDMQLQCTLPGANMTIDYLNTSTPELCTPYLTEDEAWGAISDGDIGGNAINHEATPGASVIEASFAMTDLCAA